MVDNVKCHALFLFSISLYYNSNITINDSFLTLLNGFFETYDSILYLIKYNRDNEEDNCKLWMYLNELNNPEKLKKMYDDIGDRNIEIISTLARKFCKYVSEIYNMDTGEKIKVRS